MRSTLDDASRQKQQQYKAALDAQVAEAGCILKNLYLGIRVWGG